MRAVARTEEALGAAEQAVVVLVPTEASAGPERFKDLPLIGVQRGKRLEHSEDVERAVLVGERERVLIGQRERIGLRVVRDVNAGGLVCQPLTDVSFAGARAAGQLR